MGGDGLTNERTDGRTKVPLCSTGLRPLRGRCPKKEKSDLKKDFEKEKDEILKGEKLKLIYSKQKEIADLLDEEEKI